MNEVIELKLRNDNNKYEMVVQEISANIENYFNNNQQLTPSKIMDIKMEICRKHHINKIPRNSEILNYITTSNLPSIRNFLKRRSVRSRSGVAIITAITNRSAVHTELAYI